MVYYDYSISFASFASDLKDKLVANGWTQEEGGYNTCKPAGYATIYVEPRIYYPAVRYGTDASVTTYNWNLLGIRMRSSYDATNHRPLTSANGGHGTFRLTQGAVDYSASATALLFVRGWIWNKGFILYIRPDPNTVTGVTRLDQVVICAEGQAVDASANTMLLLAPTWNEDESEYGTRSVDATNFDNCAETHFIHCLADGHGYIPICLGFGVSSVSNKVRTMPLYAWRYRGDGQEQQVALCYQIPEIRAVLFADSPQIEQYGDTFTVDTQTFKLCYGWLPNYRDTYGRVMISKVKAQYVLAAVWYYGATDVVAQFNWTAWIRSA